MTNCTVSPTFSPVMTSYCSMSSCSAQAKLPFQAKHQIKRMRRVVPRRFNILVSSSTRMEAPTDVQHKAVRFPFQLTTVKTFEKVDQKEAGHIWYSAEENKVLVNDCLKSVMAFREAYRNNDCLDDSEHTELGLERHISPDQALLRRAAVEAHVRRMLARSRGAVVRRNPAA